MPKRKKVAAGRTQNFAWHQSAQRVELDSNAGSNSPTASSEPLPTSESQPVASSSKSTLDKVQTTRENTKSHTPESPDNLVGGLDNLKRNMLNALESVKLVSIRRFAARSQRFVHAYGRGLSGSEAAWAAKQYRGHRIIPDALLEAMDDKE